MPIARRHTLAIETRWGLFQQEMSKNENPQSGEMDEILPMRMAARASAEDNPRWHEAMNRTYAEEYWMAIEFKLDTLERKMDAWDIMDRHEETNVLQYNWEFKCKHFPDDAIRKLKSIFCVRGDQQVKGVESFETFSPVV